MRNNYTNSFTNIRGLNRIPRFFWGWSHVRKQWTPGRFFFASGMRLTTRMHTYSLTRCMTSHIQSAIEALNPPVHALYWKLVQASHIKQAGTSSDWTSRPSMYSKPLSNIQRTTNIKTTLCKSTFFLPLSVTGVLIIQNNPSLTSVKGIRIQESKVCKFR